jgi:predicted Zn-dependent protease
VNIVTVRTLITLLSFVLWFTSGCATYQSKIKPGDIPVPPIVSVESEQKGHEVFSALTEEFPLSRDDAEIDRVRNLVERLTTGIYSPDAPWHVYVLEADGVVNAGATYGNHLFVWSGLLDKVNDDDELATVIAHEIGHLLADHPTLSDVERTRTALSQTIGSVGAAVAQSQGLTDPLAKLAGQLLDQSLRGIFVYPDSRRKELEADLIGLFVMADAGIDPRRAIDFWERSIDQGIMPNGSISFFSTHPLSKDRLVKLREYLPQARERYLRRGAR